MKPKFPLKQGYYIRKSYCTLVDNNREEHCFFDSREDYLILYITKTGEISSHLSVKASDIRDKVKVTRLAKNCYVIYLRNNLSILADINTLRFWESRGVDFVEG